VTGRIDPDAPAWQMWAACRDSDPDLFFPDPSATAVIAEAKRVCGRCPVVEECGNAGLDAGDRHGIRAGRDLSNRAEWKQLHMELGRPLPKENDDAPRCAQCGGELANARNENQRCWICVRGLIDSGPSKERIKQLRDAQWTWPQIQAATGVDRSTLIHMHRSKRVHKDTEQRILAVPAPVVEMAS
jgi:WhiB family redox-sensing transcriptional regulator